MRFNDAFHYKNGVTFRCRTCNRYIDRCRCLADDVWRKAVMPGLIGKTPRVIIQLASGERRTYHRSAFQERGSWPLLSVGESTNFKSKGDFLVNRQNEFFEVYEEVIEDPDERLFRFVLTSKQRAALVRELDRRKTAWRQYEGHSSLSEHFENEKAETAELHHIFAEGGEDVRPEDVL